ncbi:hypothetical protein [Clostridium aciditolerans]|uniref:Uncharacterized protein n=1 Tax=Clostridium aciditolerans TaxID=339861 RepID=A0A934M2N7_9CLOT|nr:hypothetical protein [Clostridium aciditolerans]MBI6872322.1 hypothetical protein [Clostridium aciditolerans]
MIEMNTRQYIPRSISVDDFFKLLNKEQIKYIILRWTFLLSQALCTRNA